MKATQRASQPQRERTADTYTSSSPPTDITAGLSHALEEIRNMQARMDGFMRTYAFRTTRPDQPRVRTRDGRPMCDICGRTGHVRQNCFSRNEQRYSGNRQSSGMNTSRPPPPAPRPVSRCLVSTTSTSKWKFNLFVSLTGFSMAPDLSR